MFFREKEELEERYHLPNPRAATSVATRIEPFLFLNSIKIIHYVVNIVTLEIKMIYSKKGRKAYL